ncbi:MAG TPA: 50S ribosomal protein L25 [Gemmatimonadaceae bacterium]|nr:50S ribosomal protein L25 [Gemmatimonadaceae bacterium]
MATESLNATLRTDTGKGAARKLRATAHIPGVVYGRNRSPQPVTLDGRELERLLERVSADTTIFELHVGSTTARTLIREVQRHPFRRQIIHVDFQELVAGELVTVDVPVVLTGIPAGVRNSGGVLDQVMRQVQVRVDPSNIPNHIDADVTELDLNDSLHVRDLKRPEGVEVLEDDDATICVVAPPRTEEAPPAPVAEVPEAPAEPELIRKPKPEEGEEEEEK